VNDIETFFEAVELKEIREFERADVAATHCGFAFEGARRAEGPECTSDGGSTSTAGQR
jgi:hypothetical protein